MIPARFYIYPSMHLTHKKVWIEDDFLSAPVAILLRLPLLYDGVARPLHLFVEDARDTAMRFLDH